MDRDPAARAEEVTGSAPVAMVKAPVVTDKAPVATVKALAATDRAPAARAASVRVPAVIRDATTIRQTLHRGECTVARVDAVALTTIEAATVADKNVAMNMRAIAMARVVEIVAGGIARLTKWPRGSAMKKRSAGVAWMRNAINTAGKVQRVIAAQTNASRKTSTIA